MTERNRQDDLEFPLRLPRGRKLLVATHNGGKLEEFKALFAPFGLELVSAGELGLEEPEETGKTFAQNARIKAHAAARQSGILSLSDDSGLCVDALGGAPGVHTARWAGPDRDFVAGMERVERELEKAGARTPAQRSAHFNATLCLAAPDGSELIFEGIVPGELVWPPRGEKGFGFDPIFMPEGFDITFGEMSSEEKHAWQPGKPGLSHRARAFSRLVEACCDI